MGFVHTDVTSVATWPKVDLVLCRDLLIHLPTDRILELLHSLKASGSRYLLTTTYDDIQVNRDFTPEERAVKYSRERRVSRKLNLRRDPFCLPEPITSIRENRTVACQKRVVGLWRFSDIEL